MSNTIYGEMPKPVMPEDILPVRDQLTGFYTAPPTGETLWNSQHWLTPWSQDATSNLLSTIGTSTQNALDASGQTYNPFGSQDWQQWQQYTPQFNYGQEFTNTLGRTGYNVPANAGQGQFNVGGYDYGQTPFDVESYLEKSGFDRRLKDNLAQVYEQFGARGLAGSSGAVNAAEDVTREAYENLVRDIAFPAYESAAGRREDVLKSVTAPSYESAKTRELQNQQLALSAHSTGANIAAGLVTGAGLPSSQFQFTAPLAGLTQISQPSYEAGADRTQALGLTGFQMAPAVTNMLQDPGFVYPFHQSALQYATSYPYAYKQDMAIDTSPSTGETLGGAALSALGTVGGEVVSGLLDDDTAANTDFTVDLGTTDSDLFDWGDEWSDPTDFDFDLGTTNLNFDLGTGLF